jgi:4-hydroxy-2-oxoglutarate aldolase
VKSGDHERARELQNRIGPLSQIVTARFSVPGLKAAMEILGFNGGFPRAPLYPVGASDKETIKAVIQKTGLFPEIE